MRELSEQELDRVSGGYESLYKDISYALISGWSSAVIGAAAGSAFPVVGTAGGAVIGFAAGSLISIGYALATD